MMKIGTMSQSKFIVSSALNDPEINKTVPSIKRIKAILVDTEFALIPKNIDDRSLWSRLLNVHDKDLDKAYEQILHALEQSES